MILNQLRATIIILLLPFIANAMVNNLVSNISDKDNDEPLVFAKIFFEGTDMGTTANQDRYFSISAINAISANHTLYQIRTFLLYFTFRTYFDNL